MKQEHFNAKVEEAVREASFYCDEQGVIGKREFTAGLISTCRPQRKSEMHYRLTQRRLTPNLAKLHFDEEVIDLLKNLISKYSIVTLEHIWEEIKVDPSFETILKEFWDTEDRLLSYKSAIPAKSVLFETKTEISRSLPRQQVDGRLEIINNLLKYHREEIRVYREILMAASLPSRVAEAIVDANVTKRAGILVVEINDRADRALSSSEHAQELYHRAQNKDESEEERVISLCALMLMKVQSDGRFMGIDGIKALLDSLIEEGRGIGIVAQAWGEELKLLPPKAEENQEGGKLA